MSTDINHTIPSSHPMIFLTAKIITAINNEECANKKK